MEKLSELVQWIGLKGGSSWVFTVLICLTLVGIVVWVWNQTRTVSILDRAVSLAWLSARIETYHHSRPLHPDQFAHARRYHRPLSVVVMSIESDPSLMFVPGTGVQESKGNGNGHGSPVKGWMQPRAVVFPLVGYILRDALRESDVLSSHAAANQYVIFLVESNRSQAMLAVQRLKNLTYKLAQVHLQAGIAEFPADGLTVEDLVAAAQAASRLRPATDSAPELAVGEGDAEGGSSVGRRGVMQ